jgi:hypothetical protein
MPLCKSSTELAAVSAAFFAFLYAELLYKATAAAVIAAIAATTM